MSEPPPRFAATRLLVIAQITLITLYVAGVVVPYLAAFTVHGTTHCSEVSGCRAPSDVFEGPVLVLVLLAMVVTMLGPPVGVLTLLMSFTALAGRRRHMSPALRRWAYGAAWATLAFVVFTLLPPGRLLLNWVLD
ncbi:MAG: hypothetical protein HOV79_09340 [Hamadaea sp.]|nr:hypothetical protein [Hamadaea sp.]